MTFYLERSTNLGGTTAVRPRTVESSFEADAAPFPQLVREEELAPPACSKSTSRAVRPGRYAGCSRHSPAPE